MATMECFEKLGIAPADILLPADAVDIALWPVVACDQYSSQPEYWQKVEARVGEQPSTFRLIIPEVWLETPKGRAMQASTVETMERYLASGVFRTVEQSFLYVERTTPEGLRRGLMAAFDLERYSYTPGNREPIRATEGTIVERLPPRIAVRRKAALECPHIMVLIDDRRDAVLGQIEASRGSLEKLYETDLMAGGGHIAGYRVGEELWPALAGALENLCGEGGLRFAVGDGNHSLATAKAYWDEIKGGLTAEERKTHPARWALAELVNLHDEGLAFHPIHRVVFHVDTATLLAGLIWEMNRRGWGAGMANGRDIHAAQSIEYVCAGGSGWLNLHSPDSPLAVGSLQLALEAVLKNEPQATVDYVHGDEAAKALGAELGSMAFLLAGMDKNDLFPAVERLGVLPKKAFSMGEADGKRFYLECRAIRP